jgi:molecular chaperone DnaK
MSRFIAVDFGTTNTVIALFNEAAGSVETQVYDTISRKYEYSLNGTRDFVHSIPSLISYHVDGDERERLLLGNQVLSQKKADQRSTFRWMKRMIACQKRFKKHVHGRRIDDFDAGKDFLSNMLLFSRDVFDPEQDEIGLTVPVDAYEDYQKWLMDVMEGLGVRRYRFLDEATAAALGNDVRVRSADPVMIFDFGGGTLDVAVVKIDLKADDARKCLVLGKGAYDIGGADIDQWLYLDLLEKNGLASTDVKHMSQAILLAVEDLKIALSGASDPDKRESVMVFDDQTGRSVSGAYSQNDLDALLKKNGLNRTIQQTITEALGAAATRGILMGDIAKVISVGGSSLLPMVQEQLALNFGEDKVVCSRPFDSVARGACLYAAGKGVAENIILHRYSLQHWETRKDRGAYGYDPLIPAGSDYPTDDAYAQRFLKGLYAGQMKFTLRIFEIGKEITKGTKQSIGKNGEIIIHRDQEISNGQNFMGELTLEIDPPAREEEKCLRVDFMVDANKRLCVTAFDLRTRTFVCKRRPVVTLV